MTQRRQRGFALLIVLATAALLALIGTRITATGRAEAQLARNLRDAAMAEAAAEGGIAEAMFYLQAPAAQAWSPDGRPHRFAIGEASVEVRLESETGKLNPNTAPVAVLVAVLHRVGVPEPLASGLASAIFDGHAPGRQGIGREYESLGDLAHVAGMTPEILAALRPVLSIYNDTGIDARYAVPALRAALAEAALGFDPPDVARAAVAITATATLANGARATRRSIIRPRSAGEGAPFRILAWENPNG